MQGGDVIISGHMSYNAGFDLMNTVDSMGEMKPGDDTTADMIGQNMDDKLSPSDAMLPTDSNDNTFSSPPFINLMHSMDAKVDSEMRDDTLESALERNSKSSRRKQSKPLRVHHVDQPNVEGEQMEVTQPEQNTEITDDLVPKDDQPNNNRRSTCNTPEFMDTEHTISCDFCPGTFNTLHALKDHLINAHAHPMNVNGLPSMYPTEYHRLASELYPVNGEVEKSQNFENGGAPPKSKKQESGDGMREERRSPSDGSIPRDMPDSNIQGDGEIKSHGTRIFHPDAFCELCDREFCNKYFLKTHKANKHGIYDNTLIQAPPPPLGQMPPMPGHMFPMFLPQPPLQLPQPPQPPQSRPENLAALSHVTSATTSLPTPIVTSLPSSLPPLPMMMPSLQPPEPSKTSPPALELGLVKSKTSETPTSTSLTGGINGTDMEDYCEICQKHFCNKYYLRKHKLDVHGIQTDPPANKRRSTNSHLDSMPFGGMGGLTSPMFLPQNIPNSMTNIMLINPFGPLMALPQSPSLFHAQLPQLPQTSTPLKSSQVMPPTSGLDDRDKEREREQRERDREQRERDREQRERERESRERDHDRERERDREDRDRDIKQEREPEHEREQGETDRGREHDRDRDGERVREFELERSFDHERERERDGEHERRDSTAGSPHSSTGQMSQEALRSMGVLNADAYCEICRKEFCNKYFLKIHKSNKHGMLLDDSPMKRSPTGSISNQSTSSPFDALGPLGDKDGERLIKRESSETPTNLSRIGTPGTPGDPNMPINFSTYNEQRHEERSRQQMEQQIRQHVDQQLRQQQAEQAMRFQADHHMRQQHDVHRREQGDREREMRQQVDQHIRNQEQMRQHADREREIRHQTEQQMSRPFDPQVRPPVDPEAICEICSKEFVNKYTLQIHRLNAHGISSRDSETASTPTSDIDKPVSLLPQPMPADHPSPLPVSSSGSDIPTMPTMFSSMIAAKLADRVLCDICNKEVCNKYFLKTHKLKMHGIPPPPGSTTPKSQDRERDRTPSLPDGKMSPVSPAARLIKSEFMNGIGSSAPMSKAETLKNSDKPLRHDELLKMGIDPEAYCELCKKEFCSKYFLRTHKLNMHGIRSDKPEPPLLKKEDFLFKDYSKERERLFFPFLGNDFPYGGFGHPPQSLPLPPPVLNPSVMEEGSQDSTGTVKSSNADTATTPFDPVQSSPLNLKSEKSKTREPANMIRVKCEICNKELCNKYFLRTHKLNKHGILDESFGLNMNTSFKLTDLQKNMLMAENPLYFNGKSSYMDRVKQEPMDGILDAQLKLNALESQRTMESNHGNGGSMDSSQCRNQSPVNDNQSDSSDGSRYFRYYTEVCHICQRRFKSLKWLKTHLVVEHNIKEEYLHDMLRENARIKDSIIQTCSLCGMLFPDKVGLQIHMLQEHNAEVTLPDKDNISPKSESKDYISTNNEIPSNVNSISQNLKRKYSRNAKQKLHSCSRCDYKTRWLSNIYTHEERKHNIRKPRKHQFACNKCHRVFRYEHSLYRHNMECHKLGSNTLNHLTNGKSSSKFRCIHCKTRFATRKLCMLHIRQVHRTELDSVEKKFRCSQCEYKTNFATNYRNHLKQKHAKKMLLEPLQNGPCNGEMGTDSDEGKKTPVAYATPCDLTSQSSFIMQPFKLMDDTKAGQFVTAVVYLPVYQKISEPVTVSFQLSPTEQ